MIIRKTIFTSNFRQILTKFSGHRCERFRRFSGDSGVIKLNFHQDCEDQINLQINEELKASYAYLSLAYHFEHPTVSLKGFFNMFLFYSKEETVHAQKLIAFQNMRGGKAKYSQIEPLATCDWTPETAVEKAIELEKSVTKNLLVLHDKGTKHNDSHLCDFIESEYLIEQYDAIKEFYHLLTTIKSVDKGTGIYILDKDLKNIFENKKIKYCCDVS